MSQQHTSSVSTDHVAIRGAKCMQCGGTMSLVMFEPAEMHRVKEDTYVFRCACGTTLRETVPRR